MPFVTKKKSPWTSAVASRSCEDRVGEGSFRETPEKQKPCEPRSPHGGPQLRTLHLVKCCGHHLAILNHFIFTLMFGKGSLMGSSERAQRKCVKSTTGKARTWLATRDHASARNSLWLKTGWWHSRKCQPPRSPVIIFLTWLTCIGQPHMPKTMLRERPGRPSSHPCQSFLARRR